MGRKLSIEFVLLLVTLVATGISCDSIGQKKKYPDTPLYDLSHPHIIDLPEALDEISGVAYYPKDTSVFAIIDEDGTLFKIPIMRPKQISSWRFDKSRDYEDVVLVDSVFYILESGGDIFTVRFNNNEVVSEKANFSDFSKKSDEFESLYYDQDIRKLVMVCKDCKEDSKETVTAFSWAMGDSSQGYQKLWTYNMYKVFKALGKDKTNLKFSAASINPFTKEIYAISSIHSVLVILSKNGEVKEVYPLDPGIYKQPEGITFTPQGDLIISSEFANNGFGQLLIMKNKLKGR
jgi:uncharacterized protein YjiK